MNRKVLGFLLLGLCVLSSPALAMTAAEEEEAWKKEPAYGKTIRIGYNGGLCQGTFGIAQMKGFYEAQGLQTEVLRMVGGGSASIDALGTGKVDVAGDHIATLLMPTVNGVRVKFTTGMHTGCKSLYVLASSDIQSTADLKGRFIAIPDGIGGSDHNITLRFLNKDKIDPREVRWKVVESGAAILAMQNGEISAVLLSDQFAKQFLDNGTLRIIRSLTFDEDFKTEACCVHAVNLDFYEENPITVKKLTRAHEAASQWIMDNPEETVKVLQENQWASGDYDLVLDILKTYDFTISDELTGETLRNVIDDYKTFGLIDSRNSTEELLDRVWDPVLSH